MSEIVLPQPEMKKNWTLTPRALQKLLRWLDGDNTDSDGQRYLEMRRRLVAYFDRKNCLSPDELADETLNRVARRLEEEGDIESETPAKYCYIVARFVFMEHLREIQKGNVLHEDIRRDVNRAHPPAPKVDDEAEIKEKMLQCLERCADKLESPSRQIITRYYTGKERVKIDNRRALASEMGITVNALSIRACRIRDKLEMCVKHCVGAR